MIFVLTWIAPMIALVFIAGLVALAGYCLLLEAFTERRHG